MVFQGKVYNQEWSQPQVQLPFKGGAEAETGKQVCEASSLPLDDRSPGTTEAKPAQRRA